MSRSLPSSESRRSSVSFSFLLIVSRKFKNSRSREKPPDADEAAGISARGARLASSSSRWSRSRSRRRSASCASSSPEPDAGPLWSTGAWLSRGVSGGKTGADGRRDRGTGARAACSATASSPRSRSSDAWLGAANAWAAALRVALGEGASANGVSSGSAAPREPGPVVASSSSGTAPMAANAASVSRSTSPSTDISTPMRVCSSSSLAPIRSVPVLGESNSAAGELSSSSSTRTDSSIDRSSASIEISCAVLYCGCDGSPMRLPIFSTSASTENGLCRYSSARVLSLRWSSKSFSVASAEVTMSGTALSDGLLRSRLQMPQPVFLGSMHRTTRSGRPSLRLSRSLASDSPSARRPRRVSDSARCCASATSESMTETKRAMRRTSGAKGAKE